MKNQPIRIFCYPADIQSLTGKAESTCRRIHRAIRKKYQCFKPREVTDTMIAEYLQIPLEEVHKHMRFLSKLVRTGLY